MSDDIEYLYGNFSGKSTLDKKIKNAEEILNQNKRLQEEHLEELFDKENMARVKAMKVKDMSWQDAEILNAIKKKYSNVGKVYDGSSLSDVPQSEGSVPDTTKLRAEIINTANSLLPMIQNRGIEGQPIPEGADLHDILYFVTSLRDSLKNSQQPVVVSGLEDPEAPDDIEKAEKKFKREELLAAKYEIEKMLRKGIYLQG